MSPFKTEGDIYSALLDGFILKQKNGCIIKLVNGNPMTKISDKNDLWVPFCGYYSPPESWSIFGRDPNPVTFDAEIMKDILIDNELFIQPYNKGAIPQAYRGRRVEVTVKIK